MRKFEDATARPYGYLVLDLKSSTSEQDRLQTDIFVDQQSPYDGDISDDEDADSVESLDYIRSISPPDKERDESYKPDIWNRSVSDLSPPGKRRKQRDERSKLDGKRWALDSFTITNSRSGFRTSRIPTNGFSTCWMLEMATRNATVRVIILWVVDGNTES